MTYKAINPFDGKLIREFPNATDLEVERALENAHEFYMDAKHQPILEREKNLKKIADELRVNTDYYAKILTLNMGKLFEESQQEVIKTAEFAEYYAQNGDSLLKNQPYEIDNNYAYVEYDSIGAIMAVEPWNFPFMQVMRVFAPNYIIGNPTILKHASIVPEAAQAFEEALIKADLPIGAFKNLFISYDQVNRIIADPRVQGVALTGSERAGMTLAAEAGRNLKKSTMELGGTDVLIVLDDADLKLAIKNAISARLGNAGQACTSAKRFIVNQKVYNDFIEGISAEFAKRRIGDPLDLNTTLAPLSSKSAQEKLKKQVDDAISGGSKVIWGDNNKISGPGASFNPLIISGMTPDNPMYDQELFGPVAQVLSVKDDIEAIKIANYSNYGLGGAIYSTDVERAQSLARHIETGMVAINQVMTSHAEIPFGGVKKSGYGRELSDLGIKEFANAKTILYK
ncbi:NAD-dependent succinate-semialdehyde dehydrogenase [Companilactobacillus baiquanensis]|uniref:NAD-dependent succinate-semialdehyde dehydrogenase n=1 Tax=Companilactobacillus baiquanensis TaxID=2486005 RepID=A0ABW1UUI9_9LACO|nr:NAD-dependent succinate-semialdehyde dehydrogenase [Companilactobacillus baiquanensis]